MEHVAHNKKQKTGKNSFLIFLCLGLFLLFSTAMAASNISVGVLEHWAWNDVIGWIDFCELGGGVCANNVNVFGNRLEGYADSAVGPMVLNCLTTPNGPICGVSDFKVTNDGTGLLAGYGWNDDIGWISFWCGDDFDPVTPGVQDTCTAANYRVTIDANGDFAGYAWNELVGFISFNCNDDFDPVTPGVQSNCGTSNYKINTAWRTAPAASGDLTSSVFDTGVLGGAALNSILWQGTKPSGTNVKFQIASSNDSTGPWIFMGPSASTADYYVSAGPDIALELTRADHYNKRYFRYKARLEANALGDLATTVDDIIINWSR